MCGWSDLSLPHHQNPILRAQHGHPGTIVWPNDLFESVPPSLPVNGCVIKIVLSNILNSTSAKRWECIPFCFIIHVQYTFIYFMKKKVKFWNTGALSDIFFVTSVLSRTCLLGKPPCEERDQVLWVYLHEALLLRSDKAHLILLFCQFW